MFTRKLDLGLILISSCTVKTYYKMVTLPSIYRTLFKERTTSLDKPKKTTFSNIHMSPPRFLQKYLDLVSSSCFMTSFVTTVHTCISLNDCCFQAYILAYYRVYFFFNLYYDIIYISLLFLLAFQTNLFLTLHL